jgi:hypothetical protein
MYANKNYANYVDEKAMKCIILKSYSLENKSLEQNYVFKYSDKSYRHQSKVKLFST